ncbi:MAG: hypothetical protein K1X83_08510 [Oligoflexia bacterium]|nr:hypothetical protein [Oligoflexia bacterium]
MPTSRSFLPLAYPSVKRSLAALAVITALLIGLRWQAVSHLSSHYLGGFEGDGGLYVWLTENAWRDLTERPWFNTGAFYPYGKSLAWSDNYILPSLSAALLERLGSSPVAAYNLTLLGAAALTAFCTFLLAHALTRRFDAGLFAGIAVLSLSYFASNLGHPQLQLFFWVPLGLLFLFRFMARPNLGDAVVCGVTAAGSFLCAIYYAIFLIASYAVLLGALVLLRPWYLARREWIGLAAALLIGFSPALPFVFPYVAVKSAFGARGLYESFYFSATALSYFSAAPLNFLYSSTAALSHSEAWLFPGFAILLPALISLKRLGGTKKLRLLNIALLGAVAVCLLSSCLSQFRPWSFYLCAGTAWIALVLSALLVFRIGALERQLGFEIFTNRALQAQWAFLALTFLVLSLGPLGNPEKGEYALGVFRLFYAIFPGMDSLRAISRAGIMVIFAAVILASFFLAILAEKKAWGRYAILALSCLVILEGVNRTYPLDAAPPLPAVLAKAQEKRLSGDVVLFLPMSSGLDDNRQVESWGDFATNNVRYMNWAATAGLLTVNGYSGQRTNLMRDYPGLLRDFPDDRSIARISAISNLRFVVVQTAKIPNFSRENFFARIKAQGTQIALLGADDTGNYLFEFIGQTKLSNSTALLFPSFPLGFATLELMAPYEKIPREIALKLKIADTQWKDLIIKTNGLWENYAVPLPESTDLVKPFKLSFELSDGAEIYLRSRRFAPQ